MKRIWNWILNLLGRRNDFVSGGYSKPGKYDSWFEFNKLFGSTENIPSILHNKTRFQNQNADRKHWYACTCFGASHIINEMAYNERGKEFSKDDRWGKELWLLALQRGANENAGRYFQGGLDLLREQGLISGYSLIKNLSDVKSALARGNLVAAGAANIDRQTTGLAKYMTPRPTNVGGGHLFAIVGYDDFKGHLIAKNSGGQAWGDEGLFYIRYSDIGLVDTLYACHNENDAPKFVEQKRQLNLMRAKTLGRRNGQRPQAMITKTEWDIIVGRVNKTFPTIKMSYKKMSREEAVLLIFNIANSVAKSKGITL